MDDRDFLWKQIEKDIDLYKFYLELLIKSAIFVFGITGGIITYYFSNEKNPLMGFSLFIPILMNLGCFLICFYSHKFAIILKEEHYNLCENAGVTIPYEMSPLSSMLKLLSIIYGVVVFGIGSLFIVKMF